MAELLIELVVQLLAEIVFGPLVELFLEAVVTRDGRVRRPLVALFFILLGGVAAGVASSWVLAERLVTPLVPGASLFLSPLALGIAMHVFGGWRLSKGHTPTTLATFWGGAALGLGIAAGRLLALLA